MKPSHTLFEGQRLTGDISGEPYRVVDVGEDETTLTVDGTDVKFANRQICEALTAGTLVPDDGPADEYVSWKE